MRDGTLLEYYNASMRPHLVFLSYASEDAAAADRIEASLRAVGVNVWRDRSELRGGDAWDDTIRRRIRECSLFLPLLSVNAARRTEGYFRLEWMLADERAGRMSRERPFLVPISLDGTQDAGAPESFLRVQCTRLDGGATTADFCRRILALLERMDGPAPVPVVQPRDVSPARPAVERQDPPQQGKVARREPRVAVLSFTDMSPGRDQDYFCDGIAEEITNALTRVRGLRVASRSAAFRFKGQDLHPTAICTLLNVTALLQGSVRRMEGRVRVSAQLVESVEGFTVWSGTFDRELQDIFAVQDEIARHVVDALSVHLLAGDAERLHWRGTADPLAYDCYLRGRYLLNKEKEAEQRAAVELFREAIRRDPGFAYAYSGLADVLTQLLKNRDAVGDATPADAVAAARRAIELAPDLPDSHVASGNALQLIQDHAEAKAAFERALRLDDRHFHAHYWFAKFWAGRGDHAAAVRHYERAFEIQPDDYRPIALALQEYQALKDATGEREALRRSWSALERHLAIDPDDSYASDHAAGVLMMLGRKDEALRMLDRALTLRPDDFRTLYTAACTAALGGMYDRALDFLDRAVGPGRGQLEWLLNDNDLAPLRDSPRFQAIVARLR